MKKISIILMLIMLISVGVYSTSNEKPKVKDNVHNKYVPNESQKKTAENSKNLAKQKSERIQTSIYNQRNPRKRKLNPIQ